MRYIMLNLSQFFQQCKIKIKNYLIIIECKNKIKKEINKKNYNSTSTKHSERIYFVYLKKIGKIYRH